MPTLPLEQTAPGVAELIEMLPPGEDVVLTRGGQPVATIRVTPTTPRLPRRLGTLKGTVLFVDPGFDNTLSLT